MRLCVTHENNSWNSTCWKNKSVFRKCKFKSAISVPEISTWSRYKTVEKKAYNWDNQIYIKHKVDSQWAKRFEPEDKSKYCFFHWESLDMKDNVKWTNCWLMK